MPRARKPHPAPSPRVGRSDALLHRIEARFREHSPESLEEANALVAELIGAPAPDPASLPPLEQAQMLAYEAMEDPNARRRSALARQALEISSDCADAYLILSEEADDVAERYALARDAVAAGERALAGEIEALVERQAMWLAIESRPYMRALELAASLEWEMGDRPPAIARGWELLRLNPNDNQGMRFVQLLWLLHAGSLADIDRLLSAFPDEGSAAWTFGRALHLFRSRGEGAEANAALTVAKRSNRHVVPYLLGDRELPFAPPEYIGYGDESEAAAYALFTFGLWADTPGSLDWLASRRGSSTTRPARKRR